MKILLTGATGFVGGALLQRLARDGEAVTALARRPGATLPGTRVVRGDLHDPDALAEACRGVDVVVHCAARSGDWGNLSDYLRDNVEGTLNLLAAARSASVQRFVYLSSISVYGLSPPPVVDEDGPVAVFKGEYPYAEAKLLGERACRAFGHAGGMDVVVARVGSVYGPGSEHWTARPVKVFKKNPMGMLLVEDGQGLHNYVYIDNLVEGLVLCARHEAARGGTFNLTDGTATYREFFGYYGGMLDGHPRTLSLGRRQAMTLAFAMEQVARARRETPLLTRIAVALLCRRSTFPSGKARKLLGWAPAIGLDEGMARCESWLAGQGLL